MLKASSATNAAAMRKLSLLPFLALLGACAGPVPQHDPQMAWVELYTQASYTLLAQRLDGKVLRDGRDRKSVV